MHDDREQEPDIWDKAQAVLVMLAMIFWGLLLVDVAVHLLTG